MHDPSETDPGPPQAPARQGGPRHAAPEDVPALAVAAPPGPPPAAPAAPAGRRATHRRRRGPGPAGRRGRWLALVAALLAVGAVLAVGLVHGDDGASPGIVGSTAPQPAGAPAALVDWMTSQLPDGGTVAAPPELRDALLRAGVDAAALPQSPAEGGDPGSPALAVVGSPPPGSRVLARFEPGGGAAPLLLVDPAPVDPTDEQRARRETLAAAVLANPTTRAEDDARAVLAAADVDPRLLSLVAALTAREGVGLWAFPALPGEEPGAAPARRVVVDAVGGTPVPADGATTQRLVAWLDAQLPPFAPDVVEVTGDGVLIAFDYVPGPDAVVSAATP